MTSALDFGGRDMAAIRITLPYPPTMNTYWRNVLLYVGRGASKKPMARTLISSEGRDYKAEVKRHAEFAGLTPLDGPLHLELVVYRPRRIGDLDNTLKPLLDALKGIAFHDDAQVVRISAARRDDKDNPRAEVTIRQVVE